MASTRGGGAGEAALFRRYFSKLSNAIINPGQLADALYSREIIDQATRLDAGLSSKNALDRASKLLSAVERVIKASPEKFELFLSVLKEELTTESLLKEIEEQYQDLIVSTEATPTSSNTNELRSRTSTQSRVDADTTDGTEEAFSYWPAFKGIGTVVAVSLLLWIICMIFYTAGLIPFIVKPHESVTGSPSITPPTVHVGDDCHQLTNPTRAYEELQMEISDAKTFGVHLGLPLVTVEIIDRENRSEREKLIHVLQSCHDMDTCSCWEDIVKALLKYGNTRKAKEIQTRYTIEKDEL